MTHGVILTRVIVIATWHDATWHDDSLTRGNFLIFLKKFKKKIQNKKKFKKNSKKNSKKFKKIEELTHDTPSASTLT